MPRPPRAAYDDLKELTLALLASGHYHRVDPETGLASVRLDPDGKVLAAVDSIKLHDLISRSLRG